MTKQETPNSTFPLHTASNPCFHLRESFDTTFNMELGWATDHTPRCRLDWCDRSGITSLIQFLLVLVQLCISGSQGHLTFQETGHVQLSTASRFTSSCGIWASWMESLGLVCDKRRLKQEGAECCLSHHSSVTPYLGFLFNTMLKCVFVKVIYNKVLALLWDHFYSNNKNRDLLIGCSTLIKKKGGIVAMGKSSVRRGFCSIYGRCLQCQHWRCKWCLFRCWLREGSLASFSVSWCLLGHNIEP